MTKSQLRQWANSRCQSWNWDAGIPEIYCYNYQLIGIAVELQEHGITAESAEFALFKREFNKFFKNPTMPCDEALGMILTILDEQHTD